MSLYPVHGEMVQYLQAYADHFGVTDRIRFRSRVTAIELLDGRFTLRLENGHADTFDGAAVATGHQGVLCARRR